MIENFFNPAILASAWRILLAGLENTVLLSLLVVPLGVIGGVVLASLAGIRHALVRWPLMAWVDFFRAFPPLVLLIFLYAGLPFAGIELGGFGCVGSSTRSTSTARWSGRDSRARSRKVA